MRAREQPLRPMSSPSPIGDFADARRFPVDLGVRTRAFLFLRIEEDTLDSTPFIDHRIAAPIDRADRIPADRIVVERDDSVPTGWLWHTSYCGSSLLARALHAMPGQVSLKEPLILRRLGDAREKGFDLTDTPQLSARLLARPWHPGGGVLIKPTHAALNVAVELMHALPASRALLLHSELEDFLLRNVLKGPTTQARIGLAAERALRATSFLQRLPREAAHPPDIVCAAALQWAAQRELALDVIEAVGGSRMRTLGAARLYADVAGVAQRVQQWLGLPAAATDIEARVARVADRHSKNFAQAYGPEERRRDDAMLRERHGPALVHGMRWTERMLLPAMRREAIALPFALDD